MSTLRFKTTLDFWNTVGLPVNAFVMMLLGVMTLKIPSETAFGLIIGIGLILLGIYQLARIKVFYLYDDILSIRSTLWPSIQKNVKTTDIKEVRFAKMRHTLMIHIDSKDLYESYTITFSKKELFEFEKALQELNIKAYSKNI